MNGEALPPVEVHAIGAIDRTSMWTETFDRTVRRWLVDQWIVACRDRDGEATIPYSFDSQLVIDLPSDHQCCLQIASISKDAFPRTLSD